MSQFYCCAECHIFICYAERRRVKCDDTDSAVSYRLSVTQARKALPMDHPAYYASLLVRQLKFSIGLAPLILLWDMRHILLIRLS